MARLPFPHRLLLPPPPLLLLLLVGAFFLAPLGVTADACNGGYTHIFQNYSGVCAATGSPPDIVAYTGAAATGEYDCIAQAGCAAFCVGCTVQVLTVTTDPSPVTGVCFFWSILPRRLEAVDLSPPERPLSFHSRCRGPALGQVYGSLSHGGRTWGKHLYERMLATLSGLVMAALMIGLIGLLLTRGRRASLFPPPPRPSSLDVEVGLRYRQQPGVPRSRHL